MERSVMVEEVHQKSDATPASKSLGSLIKIDSISIDLASAMEKNKAGKCEHFSIRGYVAEMRKKDWTICSPFVLNSDCKSENQSNMLPPLHVKNFRWWCCQNCLQESGTSAVKEMEMVPNYCKSGFLSSSSACSHMKYHGDVAVVLSDVRKASKLDNFERKKSDGDTTTNMKRDEFCFTSHSYKKLMKDEIGHTAVIGHEDGYEDDASLDVHYPTSDVIKSNPCLIQERSTDDTVVLKSKDSGLVESPEPNCRGHEFTIVPAIEHTKSVGISSAEIYRRGKQNSANSQQRNLLTDCRTHEVVGEVNEAVDAVMGPTMGIPSHELEDCDIESSESDEILIGNGLHSQCHDKSTGLVRKKIRKVRLLTELLGARGNAEDDCIRKEKEGSFSNSMPDASAGSGSPSAPQSYVPVEGNLEKVFSGPSRKRKVPGEGDWKSQEMSFPGNMTKKFKALKRHRRTPHMSTETADSDSGGEAFVGVGTQSKHRFDRNLIKDKKKNKEPQVCHGYSPLVPWHDIVPEKNQIRIGDSDKCRVATDVGFPNSTHDSFSCRGMEQYLKSHLSTQQAERNLISCERKNKMPQVNDGQVSVLPERNSVFEEGSVIRKDVEIMRTGPEGVKLQLAHNPSAREGLNLSLNSCMAVQRADVDYFAPIEDGIDPILHLQKGIPKEESNRRKDFMYDGEASVPRKSTPDPFFTKGLLCDLNERIIQRTSFLQEMQNHAPLDADGNFSLHKKLNISDSCNGPKNADVQEHPEVIKKPSGQRADKVFEQGTPDDIPMDIVELMAKNQYERLHEAERNYCLPGKLNNNRNAGIMGLRQVHRNGVLESLQEENAHMRKLHFGSVRNGIITTGENVGSTKPSPVNYFSHVKRNHFNMAKLDSNPAFSGFSMLPQSHEKPSGGVQYSISGPIRNSSTQNGHWNGGDSMLYRSSPTKMQCLEICSTCQTGSLHHEEGEQVRSSMIPDHMPFGLHIPQSRHIERRSQCPDTVCKQKMTGGLDKNFLNLSATNLEKPHRNFNCEPSKVLSSKYPLVCKHGGFELNTKGIGSLELYPNETIPAMQLLSLMDAGMQSSTPFSLDGKHKFLNKPFFPCGHHPKVSVDGKSKLLDKSFLPCEHHSKEFSAQRTGVCMASDCSRHPSFAFYGKNHSLERSCDCSAAVPAVGAIASLFQNDGNFKRAGGFTGQVASNTLKRGKSKGSYSPTQNRGRRSQKSIHTNGASGKGHASNPFLFKRKGTSSTSDSVVFPLQCCTNEDSTKGIDLEARGTNRNAWAMKSISEIGICSLNRNPADFSIPEVGNVYMIRGEDLKFRKRISSKDRSALFNVDGRKRVTKRMATKERLHHVS